MGEGNGNPLQYSCLESPVDKGAWWAAVYGVAQSRTRLKQLSSSSRSSNSHGYNESCYMRLSNFKYKVMLLTKVNCTNLYPHQQYISEFLLFVLIYNEVILLGGYKFWIAINSSELNLWSLYIVHLYSKILLLSEMHFSDISIYILAFLLFMVNIPGISFPGFLSLYF